MVALGAFNVVTRYIGRAIGESLGGTQYIALQTYAYDFVFLIAAAYVMRKDGHVRVDILFSTLSQRARARVDVFGALAFLLPFCWMGVALSLGYVQRSWQQGEVNLLAGGLPIYPVKTLIPIAFALLALQGVAEMIRNIAFLSGHGDSGSVHDVRDDDETLRSVPVAGEELEAGGGA